MSSFWSNILGFNNCSKSGLGEDVEKAVEADSADYDEDTDNMEMQAKRDELKSICKQLNIEKEAVRHHRDVMKPTLFVRNDGYIYPLFSSFIAHCEPAAAAAAADADCRQCTEAELAEEPWQIKPLKCDFQKEPEKPKAFPQGESTEGNCRKEPKTTCFEPATLDCPQTDSNSTDDDEFYYPDDGEDCEECEDYPDDEEDCVVCEETENRTEETQTPPIPIPECPSPTNPKEAEPEPVVAATNDNEPIIEYDEEIDGMEFIIEDVTFDEEDDEDARACEGCAAVPAENEDDKVPPTPTPQTSEPEPEVEIVADTLPPPVEIPAASVKVQVQCNIQPSCVDCSNLPKLEEICAAKPAVIPQEASPVSQDCAPAPAPPEPEPPTPTEPEIIADDVPKVVEAPCPETPQCRRVVCYICEYTDCPKADSTKVEDIPVEAAPELVKEDIPVPVEVPELPEDPCAQNPIPVPNLLTADPCAQIPSPVPDIPKEKITVSEPVVAEPEPCLIAPPPEIKDEPPAAALNPPIEAEIPPAPAAEPEPDCNPTDTDTPAPEAPPTPAERITQLSDINSRFMNKFCACRNCIECGGTCDEANSEGAGAAPSLEPYKCTCPDCGEVRGDNPDCRMCNFNNCMMRRAEPEEVASECDCEDCERDRCNSTTFDLESNGSLKYEGGMCPDRAELYLWRVNDGPSSYRELSFQGHDFSTFSKGQFDEECESGLCSGEEAKTYRGAMTIDQAEQWSWCHK